MKKSDLLQRMSEIIAHIAYWDSVEYNTVPSTLVSDFSKYDSVNISNDKRNRPFLWHTHWAGTYLHFLSDKEEDTCDLDRFVRQFKKHTDWISEELTYRWSYSEFTEQFWFYDGDNFRQVSRETALVIWQSYGDAMIAEHEKQNAA